VIEDGVGTLSQGVEMGDDAGGAFGGPGRAVDVDVAEVGDHHRSRMPPAVARVPGQWRRMACRVTR
jgi:hypothetical protein